MESNEKQYLLRFYDPKADDIIVTDPKECKYGVYVTFRNIHRDHDKVRTFFPYSEIKFLIELKKEKEKNDG